MRHSGGVGLGGAGGGAPPGLAVARSTVTAAAAVAAVAATARARAQRSQIPGERVSAQGGVGNRRVKEAAGSSIGGGGEACKEWALSSPDLGLGRGRGVTGKVCRGRGC